MFLRYEDGVAKVEAQGRETQMSVKRLNLAKQIDHALYYPWLVFGALTIGYGICFLFVQQEAWVGSLFSLVFLVLFIVRLCLLVYLAKAPKTEGSV
jgi:hypothetical protein